jgi:MGT family glycosyltransferase
MSRYLIVVPPLTGHVNPTISIGRELTARGHTVAWTGHAGVVKTLLPEDATLLPLDELPSGLQARTAARADELRGLPALKLLWEDFLVPLARQMRPGVEAVIRRFAPDVVLVDQQAVAGAMAARRLGLPFVTLASTSAALTDALAGLPRVKEWIATLLADLEREAELPAVAYPDLSPRLVLVFTTAALAPGLASLPLPLKLVGPSIASRPDPTPFPWDALGERPRVLVSLGTVNAQRGERFYPLVAKALGGLPMRVVLVAPDGALAEVPANFIVRPRVPQLQLLPQLDAVVCHAGHNTTCETLAHGLPLVVMPIKDDQPVVAQQVVDAGAGIRLRFGRTSAAELRAAVERALTDPGLRAAAERVRESFAAAGGTAAAVDAIEGATEGTTEARR